MNAQLIPVLEERQSQGERRLPRHIGFIPDGNRRWALQPALLVLGDERSTQFPVELAEFRTRQGKGIRVNFLVNYGWANKTGRWEGKDRE
jgi:undecaprenyl pyrophosphate synthase